MSELVSEPQQKAVASRGWEGLECNDGSIHEIHGVHEMKIVAGLGNPGRGYENRRHNVGFMVLDRFARKHGFEFAQKKFRAQIAGGFFDDEKILLARPMTFMNLSGESVGPLVSFFKTPLDSLLAVADDLDMPLGEIRIRPKGGSGGHNGLKSVIRRIGTQEFPREVECCSR